MELVKMQRYESYKDSGVEWVDEVPKGWRSTKIKFHATINNGLDYKTVISDEGYPVIGSGGQFAYASRYLYDGEAVLLGRKGTIDKPLYIKGKFWTVDTMFYTVCRSTVNAKFLFYYSLSIPFSYYSTSTALPSMTQNDLKNHFLVLPSASEQTAIANFLDQKTAQIEEAIAIKERQIELLKERKQIIIQKAVTQGLNPNVLMKDSGVEWIGKVPEHWEVKRAKYLFDEINERSETGGEELLSVSHMTGVTPRSEKNVNMFMAEDYSGSKLCKKDDLVMNIMWAWMGALGVSPQTGIVSPSYGVFRQKIANSFNPQYLEYLLKSDKYVEHYNKVSTGLHSSRLRFYGHMFFSMKMGFPDFSEQNEIIDFLNKETDGIQKAEAFLAEQIEKLKEYKTTLINSAVTGKIRVAAND